MCEFNAVEWCQMSSIDVMVSQAIPKMDSGTEGFPLIDSIAYLHTTFMGHLHDLMGYSIYLLVWFLAPF